MSTNPISPIPPINPDPDVDPNTAPGTDPDLNPDTNPGADPDRGTPGIGIRPDVDNPLVEPTPDPGR